MKTKRYNRVAVIQALSSTRPEYAQVIGLVTPDTPAPFREVPRLWYERVVADCLSGHIGSFDAFPELALTPRTPTDDFRWVLYRFLIAQLNELPILSFTESTTTLSALQLISNDKLTYLAVNTAVQGQFWISIDGRPHIDVGMEMVDRTNCAHITALFGTVGGELGAMVFWNGAPSIVRSATPERLKAMLGRSIGVPAARARWHSMRDKIDPEEIRSAFFEADTMGVHPDATGSKIVDLLESSHRAGTPSRKTGVELTDLDAARDVPAGGSPSVESLDNADLLRRIFDSLTPDERMLYDAMLADYGAPLREVARTKGWTNGDVYATFKRIQGKARKITNLP